MGAKDSVNHSGRFAAKIDFRLTQPATQRQLNRLNVLPGVKVVHDVMSILRSRYGQIGLLAAVGIAVTQLPVDEVQAWAMPHSQTFVFDAIAKEAQGLQREVLPGVRLTDNRQEGDTVVYAFAADGPVDARAEKSAMAGQRCATWKPALLRGDLAAVEHRYEGDGQVQTFYIRRADCR